MRDLKSNAGSKSPPFGVADVAHQLNVSRDVVRDLLRKRHLHGSKISGQWRIMPDDLADYVTKTFEKP